MAVTTALTELYGRRRFSIRPGTDRIKALLERLGHPERCFQSVHVVGTNGKGSSAAFFSAIMTAAGYCTGLFTSPHLINYSERFRVNGTEIPPEQLDRLIVQILDHAGPDDTFFELTTALACCWFAESGVQLAVLEAGMGGRSDATAAISALATLMTPIAFDHQQWLGASLSAIAAEKVAIAQPGSTIVCAPQPPEAHATISSVCAANHNRLVLANHDFQAHWIDNGHFTYSGLHRQLDSLTPGLPGRYQLWNGACALALAEVLTENGLTVTDDALISGIAHARWPGRMERFSLPNNRELLLDGAHNPAGAAALAETLRQDWADRRIILVVGVMADKDVDGLLHQLAPLADQIITVAPDQERALNADDLAMRCVDHGRLADAAGSVEQGISRAQASAHAGDLIVVAGSLFTVGEARALLTGQQCTAVQG